MLAARSKPCALEQARSRALQSWATLDASAPSVRQEIEGMAQTSGIGAIDIYLLNAFEFFENAAATGCTSLAVATADGPIIAQNWDASPGTSRKLVLMIHRDNTRAFAMISSPGMLGWVGFNHCGLGFVTNDLMTDCRSVGLPSLVARRLMLEQNSTKGVVTALEHMRHLSGRCYLVADCQGNCAALEMSPEAGLVALSGDVILHTNHPLSKPIKTFENRDVARRVYPSSRKRLRSLRTVTDQLQAWNSAEVEAVLANRKGAPDSISKSKSKAEPTETAFSVIYEPTRRTARFCLGRPDLGQYFSLSLSEIEPLSARKDDYAAKRFA